MLSDSYAGRTDPLVAFQVHLPESAAQLGSLLCRLEASSVSGRTPANKRTYPEENNILISLHILRHWLSNSLLYI